MDLTSLRKAAHPVSGTQAQAAVSAADARIGHSLGALAQSFAGFLAKAGNRMPMMFTSASEVNPAAVAEKAAEQPNRPEDVLTRNNERPARESVGGKDRSRVSDKPKARAESRDKPAPSRERPAGEETNAAAANDEADDAAKVASDDQAQADTQAADDADQSTADATEADSQASENQAAVAADAAGAEVQSAAAAATVAATGLATVLIEEIQVSVVETETTTITISGPKAAEVAAELGEELGVTFAPSHEGDQGQAAVATQGTADAALLGQAANAEDLAAEAEALLRAAANPILTQQAAGIAKTVGGNQALSIQVTSGETQTVSGTSSLGLSSLLALADSVGAETVDAVMPTAGNQTAANSGNANTLSPTAIFNAAAQAGLAETMGAADGADAMLGEIKGIGGAGSASSAQTGGAAQNSGGSTASAPAVPTTGTQASASGAPTQAATAPKPAAHHQPLTEQITIHIDHALQQGMDKIKIQLRPETLGRVEVRLELGGGGQLNTTIIADRPEALEALRKNSGELENALRQAGLDPQAGGMQFSLRGEQQREQQAEGHGRPGHGAFGDEGVPGLGDERAEDVSNAVWERRESRASARGGLDIRV